MSLIHEPSACRCLLRLGAHALPHCPEACPASSVAADAMTLSLQSPYSCKHTAVNAVYAQGLTAHSLTPMPGCNAPHADTALFVQQLALRRSSGSLASSSRSFTVKDARNAGLAHNQLPLLPLRCSAASPQNAFVAERPTAAANDVERFLSVCLTASAVVYCSCASSVNASGTMLS